jgi:CHAT domain-containing protein
MGEFYRRHIGLQHDSARALRGAQRWLRGLDRNAPLTALPLDGHDGRPGEG